MNRFHREPKPLGILAVRYARSSNRNERTLGVLLWAALYVLLHMISR